MFRVDGDLDIENDLIQYNNDNGMISKGVSVLKGHDGTVRCLKFQTPSTSSTSYNSCLLASGGAGDCAIRIWDIQQGYTII